MSKRLVCIGDLVLDLIMGVGLPVEPGQHQTSRFLRAEPGGAGNTMIAARHMGLEVAALAVVGSDAFGEQIIDQLRAEGVDTRDILIIPGASSTVVFVLTDQESGEHVFVGNYGEGPAAAYESRMGAPIESADAVFVSGYTLTEARIVPLAQQALEHAAAQGVPIYFDVGPFMAQCPPDRARWIMAHSTVMLMTEEEIPLAAGGRQSDSGCEYLLEQGPHTLVIKHGAGGCTLITPEDWTHVPGYEVNVVDTVGAGDCFAGAFLAGQLFGLSLVESARLANAMGALVAGRVGAGRNAPSCREVLDLLDQMGEGVDFPC